MLDKVRARLLGGAAQFVDRAATFAVEAGSRRGPLLAVSHAARVAFVERIALEYPPGLDSEFFPPPGAARPLVRRVRGSARAPEVFDVTWASEYTPLSASYAERYLATRANHFAAARLFTQGSPRPLVVILHGYMAGQFSLEERVWPIAEFAERGFDVALFVLPFHGVRADTKSGLVPEFPTADPRMNIEGFRQAIRDLRAFVGWALERGHPKLGLLGMSLGGYTAALAATLEPALSFVVPVVPLASLVDFASEQGSLSQVPAEAAIECELLERVYRPVSPFSRPSVLPAAHSLVIGARADRVTPIHHARRLAAHLGAPLVAWPGGHLLQIGRRASFERVYSLLASVCG